MNVNQIINMVINRVLRLLINKGVNKGIDFASKRGARSDVDSAANTSQSAQGKNTAKRAKQAARITRRLGKF